MAISDEIPSLSGDEWETGPYLHLVAIRKGSCSVNQDALFQHVSRPRNDDGLTVTSIQAEGGTREPYLSQTLVNDPCLG